MKAKMRWAIALLFATMTSASLSLSAFAAEATGTAKKGLSVPQIVAIVISAVVVAAIVVFCIVKREQVKKFFRVYKSEVKKIAWFSWDQTKKSTLVVLIVMLVCAAAICLLDFALTKGLLAFIGIF